MTWCRVSELPAMAAVVGVVRPAGAFVAVAILLAVSGAGASEFGRRHPPGAIKDPARAEQALREAQAEEARIEREMAAREAECYQRFLVNRCRENVRRDRLEAERELRRVRVEAHDLQRRVEAEEAAARRTTPPERPAVSPRDENSAARTTRDIPPEEAARNRAEYERRVAEQQKARAEEQARSAERAQNVRESQARQAEAERRAKEKEAQRRANEERRAQRRRQIEEQEAQREEVRRKAEEAARAAGRGS